MIRIFLTLLSVFFAVNAHAANWYVDKDATGTGAGTSWANAWTSFSSVVWGASGVTAGDTLYISGGSTSKTYTESWAVGASGTVGNPITIALDSADSNHNGYVIFDYDALGDTAMVSAINLGVRDYITIDGEVNGDKHLVFKNLRHTTNRSTQSAINGSGASNITVKHIRVINCNSGVWLTYGTGQEVSYSDIQVRGEAAIRLVAVTGEWDANLVHHNTIELLFNTTTPEGQPAYSGPDGFVCGDGISIYNNVVTTSRTNVITSSQHPDVFAADGNFIKIYNNETVNVGDSILHFTRWSNVNSHDYLIYNNVFRIIEDIDDSPDYFRLYTDSAHPIESITNLKILNNTFIDNSIGRATPIKFSSYYGNPTATGIEIKNNIFYNLGDTNPIIEIANSTGFVSDSFTFANNIYYNDEGITGAVSISYLGISYTMAEWVAAGIEINPSLSQPIFRQYAYQGVNNDLRLSSDDTVAINAGVDFPGVFATDKNGLTRTVPWSIGAYEFFGGKFGTGTGTLGAGTATWQ